MEPVTTPTPTAPPKTIDRVGRYRILSELGRGSMAQVYLALDPNIDREVAVKVFAPRYEVGPLELDEMRRRFIEEAKAAARVRHEGIVTIYDADTDLDRDLSFIAMERIEGRSLWEILSEDGPMPELATVEIVGKVAMALHAAHEEGLIHLDIKPGNILCSLDGSIKVTDFGIARLSATPEDADWISGSPFYMSPEQLAGDEVDCRSDVYALGAVLYECLSGAVPLASESLDGLRYMIEEIDPRPLQTFDSRIRSELACVAMKALSKAPEDRFATAYDMAKALESSMAVGSALASKRASGSPAETSWVAPPAGERPPAETPPSPPAAAAPSPSAPTLVATLPPPPVQPPEEALERDPVASRRLEPASPPAKARPRRFGALAAFALFALVLAGVGAWAIRSGALEHFEPPAPEVQSMPVGDRIVVQQTDPYRAQSHAAASFDPAVLFAIEQIEPAETEAELELAQEERLARLRQRRATARDLAQQAMERASEANSDAASTVPVLVVEEVVTTDEEPVIVPMATLEVVFRNRLKAGSVGIWIDGEELWTQTFSGSRNVFRRTLGKDVWVTLPVPAGERTIEVRILGASGKLDLSKSIVSRFEEDETRRLRVTHIPPRSLKLAWKDAAGE